MIFIWYHKLEQQTKSWKHKSIINRLGSLLLCILSCPQISLRPQLQNMPVHSSQQMEMPYNQILNTRESSQDRNRITTPCVNSLLPGLQFKPDNQILVRNEISLNHCIYKNSSSYEPKKREKRNLIHAVRS